jgi:hypothetical protein
MMTDMKEGPPELIVGRAAGDHLKVQVWGRMHPGSDDFWDGNWLVSLISARVGGFTAEIGAGRRVDELQKFTRGLEQIYRQLRGKAVLVSMEQWISLTVECRPNGSLFVTGELDDGSGAGNTLAFTIAGLDQTDIPAMVGALAAIEQVYPVLGEP